MVKLIEFFATQKRLLQQEQEIKRLRETDPESEVADHLQGMLDRVRSREQTEMDKAESLSGKAEELRLKWDEEKQAAYKKSYSEAKQRSISELTKWGQMSLEEAEQQFQQIEHASLSASLKRHHGIAHQSAITATAQRVFHITAHFPSQYAESVFRPKCQAM